jgi:hypothetical protein
MENTIRDDEMEQPTKTDRDRDADGMLTYHERVLVREVERLKPTVERLDIVLVINALRHLGYLL